MCYVYRARGKEEAYKLKERTTLVNLLGLLGTFVWVSWCRYDAWGRAEYSASTVPQMGIHVDFLDGNLVQ